MSSLSPEQISSSLPKATASNISKAEIESIAEMVRTSLDYQPGGKLEPLIEKLGGKVDYLDFHDWLDETCDTIEVYSNGSFTIWLSRVGGLLRSRFSIAHELGHFVLHSKAGTIPMRATRSLISERVEWEANWFAAAFLMPESIFRERWARTGSIEDLASFFLVSPTAVKVRKQVVIGNA
jgi:hypothetical protein